MVGRLRHRLGPDRRASKSRKAAAARRPNDRRVAESLQKTGVRLFINIFLVFISWFHRRTGTSH